jgi:ABC-type multidrug transport system fused ATPase/permease subunit
MAAVSGALLVGFIGAWSPPAWTSLETLLFLTAVIVGGLGSDAGTFVGTAVVPVLIVQGVQFLPAVSSIPQLSSDGTMMLFSLATLGFLFWRSQGIVPERRPKVSLANVAPIQRTRIGSSAPSEYHERVNGVVSPNSSPNSEFDTFEQLPRRRGGAEPVIRRAEHVIVSYGGVKAVADVGFEAAEGEVTGLIGPNGAGKSTLLRVLRGTQPPDSGRVELAGTDLTRVPVHRRVRQGLVGTSQLAEPFARLTVIENLLVAAQDQRAETLRGLVAGRPSWRREESEFVTRAHELLERSRRHAQRWRTEDARCHARIHGSSPRLAHGRAHGRCDAGHL